MADQKKYELAYLLPSTIAEEEVLSWSGKVAKAIEDAKGLVRHQEIPKKRRLFYPINKDTNAYFGWITFTAAPNLVAAVEKNIKAMESILRYMLVEEAEALQPLRTFTPRPAASPQRPKPLSAPDAAKEPEEKLDLEELDKKLEEILGK